MALGVCRGKQVRHAANTASTERNNGGLGGLGNTLATQFTASLPPLPAERAGENGGRKHYTVFRSLVCSLICESQQFLREKLLQGESLRAAAAP